MKVQAYWQETLALKVVSSNPSTDIFTLISCKNVMFVWKWPKNKEKEAGDGPLKSTLQLTIQFYFTLTFKISLLWFIVNVSGPLKSIFSLIIVIYFYDSDSI